MANVFLGLINAHNIPKMMAHVQVVRQGLKGQAVQKLFSRVESTSLETNLVCVKTQIS
jgi:hypothetical protein